MKSCPSSKNGCDIKTFRNRNGECTYIAKQTRIVLENCGKLDAESLNEYLAAGGFLALEKAMTRMTRDEVIDEIDKSGLREAAAASLPDENGSRLPARKIPFAMWSATATRATPALLWTAP